MKRYNIRQRATGRSIFGSEFFGEIERKWETLNHSDFYVTDNEFRGTSLYVTTMHW